MALTVKQARFVDEYLIDLNATQAAIRAKYSARTANEQGARLLAKASIQDYLSKRMKARSDRTEITQERVLKEFARLAFFDPRKLLNEDGSPKPLNELDDDTAAVISGLDLECINAGDVTIGTVRKYKIADKKGALDSVARHLGMFNDKLNVNHTFSEMSDDEIRAELDALGG